MSGALSRDSVAAQADTLVNLLQADGMQPGRGDGGVRVLLLQHNAPGTRLRQTDVLVPVEDGYDLWRS